MRKISKYSFILILLVLCTISCSNSKYSYDYSHPTKSVYLNKTLTEISGLSLTSDSTIACIQDEKARVYYLSCTDGSIDSSYDFGHNGDFEGLALKRDTAYILRSDGDIFISIAQKKSKHYKFKEGPGFDFEGVCLNLENNRLLVACKEHAKKKKNKSIYIYGFSLSELKYKKEPVFIIEKEKVHPNFKASGIAQHPNGDVYIISSASKTLLVINEEGEVKRKIQLDSYIYKQPEGISINSKGNIFISNEGAKGSATLLMIQPI